MAKIINATIEVQIDTDNMSEAFEFTRNYPEDPNDEYQQDGIREELLDDMTNWFDGDLELNDYGFDDERTDGEEITIKVYDPSDCGELIGEGKIKFW